MWKYRVMKPIILRCVPVCVILLLLTTYLFTVLMGPIATFANVSDDIVLYYTCLIGPSTRTTSMLLRNRLFSSFLCYKRQTLTL